MGKRHDERHGVANHSVIADHLAAVARSALDAVRLSMAWLEEMGNAGRGSGEIAKSGKVSVKSPRPVVRDLASHDENKQQPCHGCRRSLRLA